jgi:hypothetical protein
LIVYYFHAYLELAKESLLMPDRLFHQDKLVSKELLVADLDLDI